MGTVKKEEEVSMGQFEYGEKNDSGEILVQFFLENKISICNTLFKNMNKEMDLAISK